ncbi:hypothetical protein V2A60_002962 [Cordyceps javanica]|uniref:Major facilitator superfamily transporter n=1 Tax=Cordyceps javanica TaxID=43265 RepID=A0A545W1R1_9HYPO|nr:major facilitator superfamily transporter [Cordyceps javanica]TQW07927.1 major facilitator superfamily transporter [Cordyceps javanica]
MEVKGSETVLSPTEVKAYDEEARPCWDAAASQGTLETITKEEEKRVRRKLDLYLLPALVLGFLALQFDRSNMANALTNTIRADLGLSLSQVNAGSQILQAGIVVSEIPANVILQRLGARVWLATLLAVWGTITLTQAWMTSVPAFYATRFLLGLFEGGFIPGAQYVLALFYRADELALRTANFYAGNYAATGTGSLIAAGLLELHGTAGLSGWRWLFIIEGAFTIAVSFVFFLLMPESVLETRPLHGLFDAFSERERAVLVHRIAGPGRCTREAKATMTLDAFRRTLLDVRPWLHMLLNIAAQTPKGALQLYSPSIIKSLGFDTVRANLLNAVSSFGVVVLSVCVSLASDRWRQRGLFCIVAFAWSIVFGGALVAARRSRDRWLRYALLTLLSSGNALAQALNDVWLSINAPTSNYRSVGLAMAVMGSNIGGMVGPQLFQPSDAPLYTNGFIGIMCLYASAILITLVIMGIYWRDNKTSKHEADAKMEL